MLVLSLRLTCLYFNGIEKMYHRIASLCHLFPSFATAPRPPDYNYESILDYVSTKVQVAV